MKRLLWYITCCSVVSALSATAANATGAPKLKSIAAKSDAATLGRLSLTDNLLVPGAKVVSSEAKLAQTPPPPPAPAEPQTTPAAPGSTTPATPGTTPTTPDSTTPPATTPDAGTDPEVQQIQERLNQINQNQGTPATGDLGYQPKTSPAFAIFNPVGFGADKNLFFFGLDYQSSTRTFGRGGEKSDGAAVIGIGLGDATNSIGAEISYSINSFGSSSGFGSGAFNAKLHKRIADDTSVAIGWNQFAKVIFGSGASDYPNNSYYATGTKIFKVTEDINAPFSRIATTVGVGSGVFLPFEDNPSLDRTGLNVFGSLGVRIARPVSAVVEWTGQDLAAGVSIAPFENFPLVITPAFRDITGIPNQGARFILNASVGFNF